jgi:ABC-2 type transport system ATP-binding protein
MPIIETVNLTKQYDKLVALDKLNLQVNEGEIFGLLGPNGAGKTTTLMALTSLIKPSSGTATVNGYDIIKSPAMVRKSIGIVFQDPSSDDILTGYENLKLHGMLYGMPVPLREEKIKEVLNLVDLTDRKDERVKRYSGGMRRRLEIARGLMHRPKVLFLDEPTLGLDPQSRENIWQYIENLSGRGEMSIIITTHYMEEADRLCSRLAIIDHGKVVALDSPSNLKKIIGGEVVKMKIVKPDLEAIGKLDFVIKIEKLNELIHLTVLNASANLQKILNVAGEVESVEIHTPTLNDVFLHYTGREIREDSPEGGWGQRVMNMRSRK